MTVCIIPIWYNRFSKFLLDRKMCFSLSLVFNWVIYRVEAQPAWRLGHQVARARSLVVKNDILRATSSADVTVVILFLTSWSCVKTRKKNNILKKWKMSRPKLGVSSCHKNLKMIVAIFRTRIRNRGCKAWSMYKYEFWAVYGYEFEVWASDVLFLPIVIWSPHIALQSLSLTTFHLKKRFCYNQFLHHY